MLRPAAGVALRWYYRSVEIANEERIPRDGPIFVAVNHPNALIDALVVGIAMPRPVMFTAKATIFVPFVGAFLRRAGVVPLRRAADEQQAATAQKPSPDPSRNASTFGAVADALEKGNAIVIFPEGRSHDEPAMAPLRTGLARMALMARDERNVHGIRIVPIGILFERKEEPRSRVLLQVGNPIDVDACSSGAGAVASLTELVAQRLAAVTLNFECAEDAARINRAAESLSALIAPQGTIDETGLSLRDTLAVIRRTDRVNRAVRESEDGALIERTARAEERLVRFRGRLADLGILAEDLTIDVGAQAGARLVIRETLRAVVLLPLSLWGRLTHFVPIRLARALAVRSSKSREDPAMRTLVIGLLLVLATYAIEIAIVSALAGAWWAVAFAVTLVPSASSDFRYSDRTRRLRARARTWRMFRKHPELRQELIAEADWIRAEAGAIERIVAGA
jgi:1-acyl-sn-glycerol-3-phosphate acyltransferase